MHAAQLGKALPAQVARIAAFVGAPAGEEQLARCRPTAAPGGASGRWKASLSAEQLAQYEEAAKEKLTPEGRAWLATGELPAQRSK